MINVNGMRSKTPAIVRTHNKRRNVVCRDHKVVCTKTDVKYTVTSTDRTIIRATFRRMVEPGAVVQYRCTTLSYRTSHRPKVSTGIGHTPVRGHTGNSLCEFE